MEKLSFFISETKVPYLKNSLGDRFISKKSNIYIHGVNQNKVCIDISNITPAVLLAIFAAGQEFERAKNQTK